MGKENEERLSHSQAVHRRGVLAEERRRIPPDYLEKKIIGLQQAEERLTEVSKLLEGEEADLLDPREEVSLKIEVIWLSFRVGKLTEAGRQSLLQKELNALVEENPNVLSWLTEENGNGSTRLAKIRNRVIPPSTIGNYHTKKRR